MIEFTFDERTDRHVRGVVHRRPRFGDEIGGVRIVVTAPTEKWLAGDVGTFNLGPRALAGPGGVVQLLRQFPVHVAACANILADGGGERRARGMVIGPRLEIVGPVFQAMLFHPDRIVLADEMFIGVVA